MTRDKDQDDDCHAEDEGAHDIRFVYDSFVCIVFNISFDRGCVFDSIGV